MDKDFKSRLRQFELPPPPGSWERLADALDQDALEFPRRLQQYEAAPPAGAWNKIASAITNKPVETEGKPYRINRRVIGWVAAAAAVIFAIVMIFPFNDQRNEVNSNPGIVNASIAPGNRIVDIPGDTVTQPSNKDAVQEQDVAVNKRPIKKTRSRQYDDEDPGPVAMLEYIPAQMNTPRKFEFTDADENYMTYTDDDGYVGRLPKKLYEVFECATREMVCRAKIRDLQSRVASSAVSSDFTGVLQMLRNLQENQ